MPSVSRVITEAGATPSFKGLYGFPAAACISINDLLVHGIPDDTVLKEGDIVSVDIGACFEGYHGDSAWTYAVGEISEADRRLLQVSEQALFEGLKYARAGNRLTDISHAIGEYVFAHGCSIRGIIQDMESDARYTRIRLFRISALQDTASY